MTRHTSEVLDLAEAARLGLGPQGGPAFVRQDTLIKLEFEILGASGSTMGGTHEDLSLGDELNCGVVRRSGMFSSFGHWSSRIGLGPAHRPRQGRLLLGLVREVRYWQERW